MELSLFDIEWGLFLGGLGLFLYGIVLMGDGLKAFAGDRLRIYIDKYTSKPWQGFLIGVIITAIIQSSSATTSICIGFIRAGLMTLEQAAGIIIGANIGTTITAFLIGLSVEQIAVYLIFIGAAMLLFMSKQKLQDIARILVGFGILFYSLTVMGDTLEKLKYVPEFMSFAEACTTNPFIGLFGGIVMTMAMQSSSASIGIIQLFYSSGAISFIGLIPFLFGANISTTITAVLASIGGNVTSRRAAVFHTLFNCVGATLGMICLYPLYDLMTFLTEVLNLNPMMEIAITHILFNVVTAIIVYPFIKQICAFIRKIVKGDEPKRLEVNTDELIPSNFPVVATALGAAEKFVVEMKAVVKGNIEKTRNYVAKEAGDDELFDEIKDHEKAIDKLDNAITNFLTDLPFNEMSEETSKETTLYLEIVKNLERIGDIVVNVAEFSKMVHEDDGSFTPAAYAELDKLFVKLEEMLDKSFEYLSSNDLSIYEHLLNDEAVVDNMEYTFRQNHFQRMVKKECTGAVASSVYADILSNLERIGDHCINIVRNAFETRNA